MTIGGEFEINPLLFQGGILHEESGSFYSSGRAALYYILKDLYNTTSRYMIFLPDYLCESIVAVTQLTGWKICYYPVTENLKPDLSFLLGHDLSKAAILLINYFGGVDLNGVIEILKKNNSASYIIEDNVQSLFSMYKHTNANACFSSFRKTLPVPDGGWVKSDSLHLQKAVGYNTFADYKVMGSVLKHCKRFDDIEDKCYLQLFEQGEQSIDSNLGSSISNFTLRILSNMDLQTIAERRKKNAAYLISKLKEIDIFPIVEFYDDAVPLFVPVRIENRNELRNRFFSENIFCPNHWPCHDKELIRGQEMAEHELSLIVDQRYEPADMDRIADVLKKHHGRVHHR